jgi:GNAT superfamily N-acetyltransferase
MRPGVESLLGSPSPAATLEFRSLGDPCRCDRFSCGDQDIDKWFRGKAAKQHGNLRCRVVTAHFVGNDAPVGFYSMCWRLEPEDLLHSDDRQWFSRFFRPESGMFATLQLQHVAVQKPLQRQGFGTVIMGHALNAYLNVVVTAGDIPLTLVAKNKDVESFYFDLGFRRYGESVDMPRMLLPSASVLELI